jgi:hypothetical protein
LDFVSGNVRIHRAANRQATNIDGGVSRHSFSFGRHYDPHNISFGLLIASNDDLVKSGAGYPTHPHRDVEIVTWVLEGALVHRDSTGAGGEITPGLAQRMSAGSGVFHEEMNAAGADRPVRFVQMWVSPDGSGGDPSYAQQSVVAELKAGGLVTVASGMSRDDGRAAVSLGQRNAAMHVARLPPGESVVMPNAPFVHTFVARGSAEIESAGSLDDGDSVRLTDEGGRRITARTAAEVLIWEMHAGLSGLTST